jgi:hypothetical protein
MGSDCNVIEQNVQRERRNQCNGVRHFCGSVRLEVCPACRLLDVFIRPIRYREARPPGGIETALKRTHGGIGYVSGVRMRFRPPLNNLLLRITDLKPAVPAGGSERVAIVVLVAVDDVQTVLELK